MAIRDTCEEALNLCVTHFQNIEALIPPAQWVLCGDANNWKYTEQVPAQILIQKLARYITGLKATDVLMSTGLLQEVGVMFRMLDEIGEDISFISLGLTTGSWSRYHDAYADYFWSEDPDKAQVQRKNIRSFVNRALGQADPSTADRVGRTIYKTYSDYVHARSAPIVGMIVGPPARLDVNGIRNREAIFPYIEQAPSYFYRGLVSAYFAGKPVLGPEASSMYYYQIKDFEIKHLNDLF